MILYRTEWSRVGERMFWNRET